MFQCRELVLTPPFVAFQPSAYFSFVNTSISYRMMKDRDNQCISSGFLTVFWHCHIHAHTGRGFPRRTSTSHPGSMLAASRVTGPSGRISVHSEGSWVIPVVFVNLRWVEQSLSGRSRSARRVGDAHRTCPSLLKPAKLLKAPHVPLR